MPAADQNSPQGAERRLAPLRAELLPPLPARRAPSRTSSTPRRAMSGSGASSAKRSEREAAGKNDPGRTKSCVRTQKHPMRAQIQMSGPNRRSLLLSGASLLALSAAQAGSAKAQETKPAPATRRSARRRRQAQHPHHLGRRHRLLEHQRLQPGHDGLQDAEH